MSMSHASHIPTCASDLAAAIKDCYEAATPLYPVGGGTSLDYGVPAKSEGVNLSLAQLNRIIDYPARDMTITVEAGVTMQQLAAALASEGQQLPIDVPQSAKATIGGVVATNWNGPRRYGLGTVRDYVIGISAVDGRGMAFKGGGRVVKNVAGYDFCKLLTGSCGTLGVISQVTMRVRPLAQKAALVVAALNEWNTVEQFLAAVSNSQATPTSIVLVAGSDWVKVGVLNDIRSASTTLAYLVVGVEGTTREVDWMVSQLVRELRAVDSAATIATLDAPSLLPAIIEWPAGGDSPLVIKANVRPSGVTAFARAVREVDPQCSFLSHAGSGTLFVRFSAFPKDGLSRTLISKLQPAAAALGGHIVILRNPSGTEMTQQSVFGGNEGTLELMRAVKRNFDPKGILNPGRFVV